MKLFKYLTILSVAFLATSCFDDPGTDILFEENFVTLDAASTPGGSRTYTYTRLNDGTSYDGGFTVLRASADAGAAVNVTFEIASTSTAVEGLHYTVSGNTATINAGEFSANLPFTILADNIQAGELLSIDVNITAADIDINSEYASGSHLIQISCPPNIPTSGTWTGTIQSGAFGVVTTSTGVTITPVTDTNYEISDVSAGVLPSLGCCDAVEGVFFDNICDVITITGAATTATFAYETNAAAGYGPGSWDPVAEELVIPWYEPANDFGAVVLFTRE